MENIKTAMENLDKSMLGKDHYYSFPFEYFLKQLDEDPKKFIRSVFQVFCDMITSYVGEGHDEYPDDPESINFIHYDTDKIFVEGLDNPFFADRVFTNRLINMVDAMVHGTQQNKIYIFEGPHGSGKSTFLNNLLQRFEEYSNSPEGIRYETVWILDRTKFGRLTGNESGVFAEKILKKILKHTQADIPEYEELNSVLNSMEEEQIPEPEPEPEDKTSPGQKALNLRNYIEIPCPSHDHPILMIPKHHRRSFLDDLLHNNKFKYKLFAEKEYEWVFRNNPCTICSTLYQSLLNIFKMPQKVFASIYVRPYKINRRLGEGISVFSPGDHPNKQKVMTNQELQRRINAYLGDSNQVNYIFSRYAKTNNGVYALMDVKNFNKERLNDLHNIISEGIHKVGNIEENVRSLFLALMNPEDKQNVQNKPSFTDRIEYIKVPYILDAKTEVSIYRNTFGNHIDLNFLPRVLTNFARVIIASRLALKSDALFEWIRTPNDYSRFCDKNLHLLKMEIFAGTIPTWLTEEDRKRFTAKRRRAIIMESEKDGFQGFSGRDSIKIFNEFYTQYGKKEQLITMMNLYNFFTKLKPAYNKLIPTGFLESLMEMYNYTVLQEVKESLYYYNEEQIAKDIINYMFAVNFEPGTTEKCSYTGDTLEITEEFYNTLEHHLLNPKADNSTRDSFRQDIQKEYTTQTLTHEIMLDGKAVNETELFTKLHERYVHNLKEKALDPFFGNENFRMAIKDFDTPDFKTYDKMIRKNVTFLLDNLSEKYKYTMQGAKEVCIYVIDNELATRFSV